MKKKMGILAFSGWLLASGASVYGGVFNVRDYGAVGDDKTDNTAAFSKCMEALIAAGGGKMFIPDGVYRGQLKIPPVSKPLPSWITVEIVGESEPTPVFGTIGNFPLQNRGTIVKSLATEGNAVIKAMSPGKNALYGGFSAVYVVVRNLDVRTYDDPGISGIDLADTMQCRLENVFINTDVYNVQASKPTHGTKGLITSRTDNAALTILRNVTVTGYHTGIVVYEHTDADNIVVGGNIYGLDFCTSHHASRFGRVGAYRNTHHITVSGRHGFSIEQLNTEQPGPGQTDAHSAWQTLVSDVNDPKNVGTADINYWVVVGGVGAVNQFTITGGASIRARRVGSASTGNGTPAVPTAAAPAGQRKAATFSDVSYGPHARNVLDFWKADSATPTPWVFVIHGGGWEGASKEAVHDNTLDLNKLLNAGISVVSINYRYTRMAKAEGVEPPVKGPMLDSAKALQFVRSKAKEWNLDKQRVGAAGGSAGGCSSLWLAYHDDLADPKSADPIARESTRLFCAAVKAPQTTLDPKQMKEWTPNSTYGGHAFGLNAFDQYLASREKIMPWIKEYSPYELLGAGDPPVYLFFETPPNLGRQEKDPTHTANFGVKLQEHCAANQLPCELVYPGAPDVKHPTLTDYLIATLKSDLKKP